MLEKFFVLIDNLFLYLFKETENSWSLQQTAQGNAFYKHLFNYFCWEITANKGVLDGVPKFIPNLILI